MSEPLVYITETGGLQRLVVELAGIKDIEQAIKMIGETPLLDFREVEEIPTTGDKDKKELAFTPTALTGRYVKNAQLGFDDFGKPTVSIAFNDEGAKIFEELTDRNIGKYLAIFWIMSRLKYRLLGKR